MRSHICNRMWLFYALAAYIFLKLCAAELLMWGGKCIAYARCAAINRGYTSAQKMTKMGIEGY